MKNIFLILLVGFVGALGASASFSYTVKIFNKTSSQMKVEVQYGGPGVCSPDTWQVNGNSNISNGVGGCCAKSGVKFTGTGGALTGKTFSFDPPRTGMGLSCRSWNAYIKPTEDGNFIVSQSP